MASINSVNFLRRRRAKVSKFQQLDRMFMQGSVVALVVCLALSGGMFAYWQYVQNQITELKNQQKTQQRVVAQASANEAQYVIYTQRLTTLGGILTNRTSKLRALRFLEKILRPGVSFEAITYEADTNQLKFRAKATEVFNVQGLLQAIRSSEISAEVAKMDLTDIRRGEAGDYTIDLTIVLVGQKEET